MTRDEALRDRKDLARAALSVSRKCLSRVFLLERLERVFAMLKPFDTFLNWRMGTKQVTEEPFSKWVINIH